jgi:hypothetical protein
MKGVMLISYNEGETKPEFHSLEESYKWESAIREGIPNYFSERRKQGYVSRGPLSDVEGRFLRKFWQTDAPLWKKVAINLHSDVLSLILDEDRPRVLESLTNVAAVNPYDPFEVAKELLQTLSAGPVIFYNSKDDSDRPLIEKWGLGGNIFKVDEEGSRKEPFIDGVKLAEKIRERDYTSAQLKELVENDPDLLMWHSVDEVVENIRKITTPPMPIFNTPWSEED